MNNNLGYCCICLSLPDCKVNRGMIRKTFDQRGLEYCSELFLKNLDDMYKILIWNVSQGIYVYRMSSDMLPWMTEYNLEALPNFDFIYTRLQDIGRYINSRHIRVGFHPSHFCVLNSDNPTVVEKTIKELSQHAKILDFMGLDQTPYYGINIHCNNSKPNKKEAVQRFIANFQKLPLSVQYRLTIENDDKPSLFTVKDLFEIHNICKIPIVVDCFHCTLHNNGESVRDSINLAKPSWMGIKQLIHFSSSKRIWEDQTAKITAHADYLFDKIPDFGYPLDIEIEAKAKDLAVLKYKKDYES